jgi:hypothetical protein
MAELLGGFWNTPTPSLLKVYEQWGKGSWGGILTGSSFSIKTTRSYTYPLTIHRKRPS